MDLHRIVFIIAVLAISSVGNAKDCFPTRMETLALKELYYETDGPNWRHQENWLKGNPCGLEEDKQEKNWYGVMCGKCENDVRHVEVLDLEWNNLSGQLSEGIGDLKFLKILNVGTNNLEGELPDSFNDLTNLRILKISYNKFLGQFPKGLLQAHDMEMIDLPYNDFVGNVNEMIKAYPNIKVLNVRGNRGFAGDLSLVGPEIANLSSLQVLDLHWNNVGGTLPSELFNLPNLKSLFLSQNEIKGVFPDTGDLPALEEFTAHKNYFTGSLPKFIFDSPLLQVFDLHHNFIDGTLPDNIGNANFLTELDLSRNFLVGGLSESLYKLSRLSILDLSGNELGGELSSGIGNMVSLTKLNLAGCKLVGKVPKELGNLSNLKKLYLYANKLEGEIPNELGNLINLEETSLRGNRLNGKIPDTIGNWKRLRTLLLHNNFLEYIPEQIGNCKELEILMLHDNKFSQEIPVIFGYMSNLKVLSLHKNKFTGKGIPEDYANLDNLEDFTAHDNLLESNPYPRMDSGIQNEKYHIRRPFCENLRNTSNEISHNYFRVCGTRNDFYVDVLLQDTQQVWKETHSENWITSYGKCKPTTKYDRHYDFQISSRYPEMSEVADKAKYSNYFKYMQTLKGKEDFHFHTPTFQFPWDYDLWVKEAQKCEQENPGNCHWLLKPTISCCGQNIRLIKGPDDPEMPTDLGNWIIQKFIHPPLLVEGHKFVLRLFAMLTSFSPLRIYLYPDGDVFYTHAPYSLDPKKIRKTKRGYYITDYFFTKKQNEMWTSSNQLMMYLKNQGYDTDKIYRDIQDAIIKAIMLAEPHWRQMEKLHSSYPRSVYEVFGYDIMIDKNLKPWVCEVNTTPNMGLEINRANDPLIHEEDFELKHRIMKACLEITGTVKLPPSHPNYENSKRENCEAMAMKTLTNAGKAVNKDVGYCPEDDLDFECLSEDDVNILLDFECEMQRKGDFDVMYPGWKAEEYVDLFPVERRDHRLLIWYQQLRKKDHVKDGCDEYGFCSSRVGEQTCSSDGECKMIDATPWGEDCPLPFRTGKFAKGYDWNKHKWTQNTPGNRWNTDEDGELPNPDEKDSWGLNDGDAFDDMDDMPVPEGYDPLAAMGKTSDDGDMYFGFENGMPPDFENEMPPGYENDIPPGYEYVGDPSLYDFEEPPKYDDDLDAEYDF